MTQRQCPCGSGLPREEIKDGHGIFLTFVCDKCRDETLSQYRSDIFESYDCDEDIEPEDDYGDSWYDD